MIEQVFTDSLGAYREEVLREKSLSTLTPPVSTLKDKAEAHLKLHTVKVDLLDNTVPVTMTNVNKLLLSEEIRNIVFPLIQLDTSTPFPVFEKKLLYGYVSGDILYNNLDNITVII